MASTLFFGIDCSLKNAINNAVAAGQQLLKALKAFNETYAGVYFNHSFEVGIGIISNKRKIVGIKFSGNK